jgi:hypothetical protein
MAEILDMNGNVVSKPKKDKSKDPDTKEKSTEETFALLQCLTKECKGSTVFFQGISFAFIPAVHPKNPHGAPALNPMPVGNICANCGSFYSTEELLEGHMKSLEVVTKAKVLSKKSTKKSK